MLKLKLKERDVDAIAISAVTKQSLKDLTQRVFELMSQLPQETLTEAIEEMPIYELEESDALFEIEKDDEGIYHVTGKRIEQAAAMTYWDYEEAVLRFQNILETLGVSSALEEAGVKVGDTVYIGEYELEWAD